MFGLFPALRRLPWSCCVNSVQRAVTPIAAFAHSIHDTPLRISQDHLVLLRFGLEAATSARPAQGHERLQTYRSDTPYNLICEV
jgi:hypothetical protein